MPYYESDTGYFEPSDFDIQIEGFKQTLLESVKKEHQQEMDDLRKENAELQETKKRMEEIEREHRRKMNELEHAKSTVLQEVRRERLATLMKHLGHEVFGIDYNYALGKKCDKCDEKRRIHFKSPSGKDMHEECECKEKSRTMVFKPRSHVTCAVDLDRGGTVFYRPYDHEEDYFVEDTSSTVRHLVSDEDSFEKIKSSTSWYNDISFRTQERAQEFCDWLNEQKLNKWG